jgi:hypothetical protein
LRDLLQGLIETLRGLSVNWQKIGMALAKYTLSTQGIIAKEPEYTQVEVNWIIPPRYIKWFSFILAMDTRILMTTVWTGTLMDMRSGIHHPNPIYLIYIDEVKSRK